MLNVKNIDFYNRKELKNERHKINVNYFNGIWIFAKCALSI
ncbi:hypothetical protein EAKF1_ch2708 [Escherichia albertii KF1]|nr:hypothetical protein EAKF1_ch2708 [Escherichia albertii KF1]